jgi:Rap1a immunity proteins
MGVSDALNATKPNFFCAPLSVKASQELADLRDHPETWHYSAWTDIGVALAMAFPCK